MNGVMSSLGNYKKTAQPTAHGIHFTTTIFANAWSAFMVALERTDPSFVFSSLSTCDFALSIFISFFF